MKKLSKADVTHLQEHTLAMQQAWEGLYAATDAFNALVQAAWADVADAVGAYNGSVEAFQQWQTDTASAIREYIDARSEKWQTGPVGEAYAAWIEPYEDEALIETVNLEAPEPIDPDCGDPAEALYDLNDAPEDVAA